MASKHSEQSKCERVAMASTGAGMCGGLLSGRSPFLPARRRRCAAPHSQGGRRYSVPESSTHTTNYKVHIRLKLHMFTRRRCCSATRSPKATTPRCRPGRYSSPTRPETAKLLCPALSQGPKQVCPGQKSVPRNTISRRTCTRRNACLADVGSPRARVICTLHIPL